MKLNLRPAEECTFDAVSLGEVMLRLDPGEGRIRTARSFRAGDGDRRNIDGHDGCNPCIHNSFCTSDCFPVRMDGVDRE